MNRSTALLLSLVVIVCLPIVASSNEPPTYKGMVCVGWVKPEAQAVTDGDSTGEELVVNTQLTEPEKRELYYANQESDAAFAKKGAVENKILANHHLLFLPGNGSDWLRQGPCGDTPMIRADEYHITEFVPSNPKYPGDGNVLMTSYYHEDSAKCRTYFAEKRKHAVKAEYGRGLDTYVPEQP